MAGSEHELVELVRHVVVVRDRLGVARLRVHPAVRVCLLGRWGHPLEDVGPDDGEHLLDRGRRLGLNGRLRSCPSGASSSERVDVAVDVEVTADVGPNQPELAGALQEPADGVRFLTIGRAAVGVRRTG